MQKRVSLGLANSSKASYTFQLFVYWFCQQCGLQCGLLSNEVEQCQRFVFPHSLTALGRSAWRKRNGFNVGLQNSHLPLIQMTCHMIQLFWKDKNQKLVYCCISTDDVWMVHGWLMMYWYWCNLMCGWFWMCKLLGVLVIDLATCHFLKPNELTMYFLRGNTLLVDWCLMYHCRGKLPRIISKEVWWWVFDVHWVPWYLFRTWPMFLNPFGICWYRPEDWKQPGNGSFGPCILRGHSPPQPER